LMVDEFRQRLAATASTNPNILELYLSGRDLQTLTIWAVIAEWDHDTEVNVGETASRLIAENPQLSIDSLIVAAGSKGSILPRDAERIYSK